MLQETKAVFEKLHKYIGKGIKHLVERTDEDYVLRLHKNRVFYVRESLMRRATNVSILQLSQDTALTCGVLVSWPTCLAIRPYICH